MLSVPSCPTTTLRLTDTTLKLSYLKYKVGKGKDKITRNDIYCFIYAFYLGYVKDMYGGNGEKKLKYAYPNLYDLYNEKEKDGEDIKSNINELLINKNRASKQLSFLNVTYRPNQIRYIK